MITTGKYILDENKKVVQETDLVKWAAWINQTENVIVKQEEISEGIMVSTVFLGLDYSCGLSPVECFFETMIFGGDRHLTCGRTNTYKLALEQHQRMVASLFEV